MKNKKIISMYLADWRFWYKLLSTILIGAVLIETIVMTFTSTIYQITTVGTGDNASRYYSWISFNGSTTSDVIGSANLAHYNGETLDKNQAVISGYTVSIDFIKSHKGLFKFDFLGALLFWCAFFTNQSNIIVFVYLLMLTIYHEKEGKTKWTSPYFGIGAATFITITALIFNCMLMPQMLSSGAKISGEAWWTNEILHTVGPILCVLYVVLFARKSNLYTTKDFWKKVNWIYIMYPIAYGLVTFVVGEVRHASGYPESILYPYFFLNIRSSAPIPGVPIPGYAWFMIVVVVIAGICLGFGALYNYGSIKSVSWGINKKWDEKANSFLIDTNSKKESKNIKKTV